VLVAFVVGVVLAGCGGTVTRVNAPVLTVVTSLYPLAQAVSEVGGSQVRVIDLARPGIDPRTMSLSPAEWREVRQAALVVDIGDGFQPAVESAAPGARRTLSLLPALGGTNPYIWLDPALMGRAATLIRNALTGAEPAGRSVFATGAQDLVAEASSLDIDFQNSLSACPASTFVTSDDAFGRMAAQYGITDRALGTAAQPDSAQIKAATSAIRNSHSVTAFSEPYVNDLVVSTAAQAAGVKVRSLNTLETPPVSGSRAVVSYSNLMETDLRALTGALQCPSDDGN
jgi:zinc transport system substrate-binding protein